jgi:glyoxylase-like metal-dependent hydrolase (beta-lactamase superfamily II)
MAIFMKTSFFFSVCLVSISLLLLFTHSKAQAQETGFFKTKIGNLEVTAISDVTDQMDFDLLLDIDSAVVKESAVQAGLGENASSFPAYVNAFVVKLPDGLVLVDTGIGPQTNLLRNLAAAGIDPAEIKYVLLTHYHGDHIGGLLNAQGQAAFPQATVYGNKKEDNYWLGAGSPRSKQAASALAPYKRAGKYELFSPGDEVLPGVKVVELYGHTPGHVGFMFEGGDEDLLAWGDIIHIRFVQFSHPEATMTYDVDTAKAAEIREKIFDDASNQGYVVAGAHLPFPGLGRVVKAGEAYDYKSVVE